MLIEISLIPFYEFKSLHVLQPVVEPTEYFLQFSLLPVFQNFPYFCLVWFHASKIWYCSSYSNSTDTSSLKMFLIGLNDTSDIIDSVECPDDKNPFFFCELHREWNRSITNLYSKLIPCILFVIHCINLFYLIFPWYLVAYLESRVTQKKNQLIAQLFSKYDTLFEKKNY